LVEGPEVYINKSFLLFHNYADADLLHRLSDTVAFIPMTEKRLKLALTMFFSTYLRQNHSKYEQVFENVAYKSDEVEYFDRKLIYLLTVNEDEIEQEANLLSDLFIKNMEKKSLPSLKNRYAY